MPARNLIEQARERIGNAPITQTAKRLDAVLRQSGLPYALVGGYAVQHYGYPRFTEDIDAVVRDRESVKTALLHSGQFKAIQGSKMTVVDRSNGVPVDLLAGGQRDSAAALPYPQPEDSSSGIQFISLPHLFNMKLSARRMKDLADVVELIKANQLPLEFGQELDPEVRVTFAEMHAKATAEKTPL